MQDKKRARSREELIDFLASISPSTSPLEYISDETNLIDAGIIDSFALIQIILHLEQVHGVDLQASGTDPNDLDTLSGILSAIREGGQ